MGTHGLPFSGELPTDRSDLLQHQQLHHQPGQPDPSTRQRYYSTTHEPMRDRDLQSFAPHQQSRTLEGRGGGAAVAVEDLASGGVDRATVRSHFADSSSYAAPNPGQATEQSRSRGRPAQSHFEASQANQPSDYPGSNPNSSTARPNSFFGVEGSSSYGASAYGVPQEAGRSQARTAGRAGEPSHERASSFYGFDGHVNSSRQQTQAHRASPSPGDSPTRSMQSVRPSGVERNSKRDSNSGSGSGSHSSHSLEQGSQPNNRPRMSQAPYASSRAASLYGFPSSASASNSAGDSIPPPPPAQLLDQSHLQVGNMASLLSHDKTLELYRLNAKKTNDPDIQYEFCVFVMDVVADLEYSAMLEKAASGAPLDDSQAPSQQELESKQKQQALVAESISLLNRLATRGHVNSCFFLGDCYTQGIGTYKGKRDYDKAFPLFLVAGKHGHAAGSFRAAQCLENGWGTRKDWSKAVSFYRRAAVLSHVGAMHRLGLAELNGEVGLAKRERDGVQWLTRAAELADQVDPPQPQSLHELALLHEKGIDNVVFQDEDYAAELLARAAELQYAPSAYKLGECYEYGKMGCPQDAALSIHYYNIAAQQNHPAACFALTAWYLVGSPGILPQSDTEAYLWAKKAAELGLAKAQYACGYFTEVGIGTYKDQREALDWFRRAAAQGDKRAQDRLRMAGQQLPAVVKPSKRNSPPPSTADLPTMSSLHLPSKGRRLSGPRLLRKEPSSGNLMNGTTGPKGGKKERAFSVDGSRPAIVFGAAGSPNVADLPPPVPSVDRKGKGKSRSQSGMPDMAPMQRQRSYSHPDTAVPLDYNLRPVASGTDFGPLAYDSGDEGRLAASLPGRTRPAQNGPSGPLARSASPASPRRLVPEQVQMPPRQHSGLRDQTDNDAEQPFDVKKERERVLQRRKNPGEDKDCILM
ncbi:hypothetical protein JCM10908_005452 [Rhodotorula pacifica]|uniref:SEL1-like repeat protein n=1 Tax=Rhodotorula pacifica TaxID=1495444 RepID=UPI00317FADED